MRKLVLLLVFCFFPSALSAQIKAEHPRNCIFNVGPTEMMFSAFQEGKTDAIFCQHIGDIGATMIILDARQAELNDMNIEAFIIKNLNQKDWRDDLIANTVAIMPADKYLKKKNTVSFSHQFAKEGNYFIIVKATSDNGLKEYVGQYGFSVGESDQWLLVFGLLALVIGIGAIIAWKTWPRSVNEINTQTEVSKELAPSLSEEETVQIIKDDQDPSGSAPPE
ncbi:MAG: hypothetical protein ACKOEW_05635 [Methylocystis sp.]